jgi:hypothetical protein
LLKLRATNFVIVQIKVFAVQERCSPGAVTVFFKRLYLPGRYHLFFKKSDKSLPGNNISPGDAIFSIKEMRSPREVSFFSKEQS